MSSVKRQPSQKLLDFIQNHPKHFAQKAREDTKVEAEHLMLPGASSIHPAGKILAFDGGMPNLEKASKREGLGTVIKKEKANDRSVALMINELNESALRTFLMKADLRILLKAYKDERLKPELKPIVKKAMAIRYQKSQNA